MTHRLSRFKLMLIASGLSQAGAADYLDVRLDTVKSWSTGRAAPPDGVIFQLVDLISLMDELVKAELLIIRVGVIRRGAAGVPQSLKFARWRDDMLGENTMPDSAIQMIMARIMAAGMAEGIAIDWDR